MTYTIKLAGGPHDGKELQLEDMPLPEIIDGNGENTFMYLGENFYILGFVDFDKGIAFYDALSMQAYPDAIEVEDGYVIPTEPHEQA